MSYIIGSAVRKEVFKELFTSIIVRKEDVTEQDLLNIFKKKITPEHLQQIEERYGTKTEQTVIKKLCDTVPGITYTIENGKVILNREHPWFIEMDPCDLVQDELNEKLPTDLASVQLLAKTFGFEPRELIYLVEHSELKNYAYKKTFLSTDGVNFEAIMVSQSAFFSWFDKGQWKKL